MLFNDRAPDENTHRDFSPDACAFQPNNDHRLRCNFRGEGVKAYVPGLKVKERESSRESGPHNVAVLIED